MTSELHERIECEALRRKLMPVEEAVRLVRNGDVLAVSGFTKAGEPKAFLPALARHLAGLGPDARITLYSGASLSEEVEGPLAPYIARRGPYMASSASRRLIHAGKMDYTDVHLSHFARGLMYGFYGDIDLAVVEVSRIRHDGSVVLSASVGVSAEALARARAVVLEVNTAIPDFTGVHDIVLPPAPPTIGWPVPVTGVRDRIGLPHVPLDPAKVVAVVHSRQPDFPVPFRADEAVCTHIADQVIAFLGECRDRFDWHHWVPPLQSGVGNIANAVIAGLARSPFKRLHFWTEVFQEGLLGLLADRDRFAGASAAALSLADTSPARVAALLAAARGDLLLRPMWMSNNPEVIARLHVVAMNTPLEVDIYGHVNSTHVEGSRIVNGLGGSGDFFRNAYLSIAHTPSVRTLRDGRTVSCVLPYVGHVDHTEHDIKCVVTEHGYATNFSIRSPRARARDIIDRCAHPHFRPLLQEYLAIAGEGDEPRLSPMDRLEGWWRQYDAACLAFPRAGATG
ncbi:acetyl-CoA hydrolase/transferase C-terminal domain-containing protein [Nannocystis pusilla]|uniref:Acetyl-CoA hydrolase n=1 Tax=Nannocystis pusilla TaxID=889268 RepID=A0ABS7TIT4_9BACT|nr:acetyl-CoA hydrolase/transferase C-terminal domain-containing protein [Nannocystis pusilla]MBZ5708135.1 acetyl-CoA hydrolase [Nannocystis pusilla]